MTEMVSYGEWKEVKGCDIEWVFVEHGLYAHRDRAFALISFQQLRVPVYEGAFDELLSLVE